MTGKPWPEPIVDQLRKLWSDGLTCSQIANEIGGISRCAVIGKARRLGLEYRAKEGAPPKTKDSKPRKPKKIVPVKTRRVLIVGGLVMPVTEYKQAKGKEVDVSPLHTSLIDLPATGCRYGYGDGPITFCGHEKLPTSAYCLPHHRLCWVRPEERRKAAA